MKSNSACKQSNIKYGVGFFLMCDRKTIENQKIVTTYFWYLEN